MWRSLVCQMYQKCCMLAQLRVLGSKIALRLPAWSGTRWPQVAKLERSSIAVTKIAADIRDSGGTKAGEDGSKSEAEHWTHNWYQRRNVVQSFHEPFIPTLLPRVIGQFQSSWNLQVRVAAFEKREAVFNINVSGLYSTATFPVVLARRCNDKCLFYSRRNRLCSIRGRTVCPGVTDANESGEWGFLLKLIYLWWYTRLRPGGGHLICHYNIYNVI